MDGYLFCRGEDGSSIAENGAELRIFTDKGLYFGHSDGNGFVQRWLVPKDGLVVEDVVASRPCVELYRGGDNYPEDPTHLFWPFYEDGNNLFSGKVGKQAVICYMDCISTSTDYLPNSGGTLSTWYFLMLVK